MSWYQNKANFHLSRSLSLTLTNLNSEDDEEKVINTLQNLNGMNKVTTDLPTKKSLYLLILKNFKWEQLSTHLPN